MSKPLDRTLHFRVDNALYEALEKAREEYGLDDTSSMARFVLRQWLTALAQGVKESDGKEKK